MDWANGKLLKKLVDDKLVSSVAFFADPFLNKSYDFEISPQRIYRMPFPFSYKGGMMNMVRMFRLFRQIEMENDLLVIQLPIISFIPLLFLKKPVIYHVCANVLTAAANPFKYKGAKRLLSTSFARLMTGCFRKLFAKPDNKVIVNGNELGMLFRKYNPQIVVSSSIGRSDIISESQINRRGEKEFVILFVGRPSKEKGINVLMEAFEILIRRQKPVRLAMIGVVRDELRGGLLDVEISEEVLNRIDFHGFIPWGEHFREIVQSSHCLTMCSVSEGTPRVIIESMALGCPVIATNVGGVPTSIEDKVNGMLIPYGNPELLVQAVEFLMDNEDVRMQLAANGLLKVRNFTIEKFASVFMEEITVKAL